MRNCIYAYIRVHTKYLERLIIKFEVPKRRRKRRRRIRGKGVSNRKDINNDTLLFLLLCSYQNK